MTSLERVCAALRCASVDYAIVGGHAVALHGAVRGTIDIDLILQWSERTLRQAELALNRIGLVSRLPVGAEDVFANREDYMQNRHLLAWNFHNPDDPSEQVETSSSPTTWQRCAPNAWNSRAGRSTCSLSTT